MKKLVLFILFTAIQMSFAMNDEKQLKKENSQNAYIIATKALNLLDKKAKEGDLSSTLAAYDFNKKLKNPSYIISTGSSKKLLQELALTDAYGNIHKTIREAFERQEDIKTTYATVTMILNFLDKKAKEGDMDSALAAYDFNQKLKNPNYSISTESSKKLLQKLVLIDDNGDIDQTTREAFEIYKK